MKFLIFMMDNQGVLDASVLQILHSLKVIASIKKNDRVATKKGIFIDTSDTYLQAFYRWMNSENRGHNVSTLENVFNRAFEICWSLIEEKKKQSVKHEKMDSDQRIHRLDAEIRNAQRGVSNLAITYEADTHTVAKLQLINERIHDRLQQLQCALSTNPYPISLLNKNV